MIVDVSVEETGVGLVPMIENTIKLGRALILVQKGLFLGFDLKISKIKLLSSKVQPLLGPSIVF